MVLVNKIINLNGFKETEVGTIPEEWKVMRLGSLIKTTKGKKPKFLSENPNLDFVPYLTTDYFRTGIPSKFSVLEDLSKPVFVDEKDIVFLWDGSKAGDTFTGLKGILSSTSVKLNILTDNIFTQFLFYFLKTKFELFNTQTTGSTIPHVNKSLFENLQIPLPPLPEQKKIATVLSAVQEAKEKTEQVINATKELKKSMMKHLFTYGPVPLGETENVSLKETKLGPLPEKWEVVILESYLLLNESGVWGDAPSEGEIGVEVFRSTNIQNSNWVFRDVARRHLTEKQFRRYQLKEGDILLTKSSGSKKHIGKAAYVNDSIEDRKVAFSNFMQRLRFDNRILPKFSFFYITSGRGQKALLRRSTTTTGLRNLTKTDIETLLLPLPPLPEQQKIVSILSAIDQKIEAEESEKKALEDLFKSLLHNLMTAKIRVNNLEV